MAHQKRHLASDPPHAGGSLAAVLAHAYEYAPRAPRHRGTIARRLETDLPFLPTRATSRWHPLLAAGLPAIQYKNADFFLPAARTP